MSHHGSISSIAARRTRQPASILSNVAASFGVASHAAPTMAGCQRQGNFMRSNMAFDVVYTHTEGEPTCIIHSGITYPPSSSILQKRRFIEENFDWLRTALMREPRGHKDMFGVFLTPPSEPGFDAGLIWMD